MRPSSSSSDPNAPYRAAIASLVDCNFFADDEPERPETPYLTNQQTMQHDSFNIISPRRLTQRTGSNPPAEARMSRVAAPVTIATIRQYLRDKGHCVGRIHDSTVESRLFSTNLSAETLLTALHIVYDANHALLVRLGVSSNEREILIARLNGIVLTSQGFFTGIRQAVKNANNDPNQLIACILQYLRDPNFSGMRTQANRGFTR